MATTTEEVTIETECARKFRVVISIKWHYETNYGADADGNRGVPMWLIDYHEWSIDHEINPQGLPGPKALERSIREEINTAIEHHMANANIAEPH